MVKKNLSFAAGAFACLVVVIAMVVIESAASIVSLPVCLAAIMLSGDRE